MKKSFTLLEVIIAIALLEMGVYATIALAGGSFRVMDRQKQKSIAINLAKEGVEIVRNIRDENWLATTGCDGTTNACQSGRIYNDCAATPNCDWRCACSGYTNFYSLDTGMRDVDYIGETDRGGGEASTCQQDGSVLKVDTNGYYQHNTGSPSIFKRLIKIKIGNDLNNDGNDNNDISVQSIVCWTERGGEWKQVILEDHLYNWYSPSP